MSWRPSFGKHTMPSHGNRWHKLNIGMGAVIGAAGATKAPPSPRDCALYRVRLLWRPASAVNPGRVIGLSSTSKPLSWQPATLTADVPQIAAKTRKLLNAVCK
jgi:hypothetical protein